MATDTRVRFTTCKPCSTQRS